jgi:hypothetical protein
MVMLENNDWTVDNWRCENSGNECQMRTKKGQDNVMCVFVCRREDSKVTK